MTAKKKRQRLTPEGIVRIVRAIEATSHSQTLSWADIKGLATEHAGDGYKWTRQTLERHKSIKSAYLSHEAARKEKAKGGKKSGRRLTEPQKMARLEQESEELRRTLAMYDERFATYLANAVAHGLTVEQLSRPLERPSRGSGNSEKV